ncbi:hypothetical protein JW935_00655 [candidate division KSB1 bacterium]|nr:hypothetical protein [candidate division KSB1 bacterium]
MNETIEYLRATWSKFAPDEPFRYSFVEENWNELYQIEENFGKLINRFTFLAIITASLGLLGLTLVLTQNRLKEISIRKVMGASIQRILFTLYKDVLKWVTLAAVFALPFACCAMNIWLQHFAYRINVTVWPFVLAGLTALIIALLTVSWQTLRVATVNPVDTIRYE